MGEPGDLVATIVAVAREHVSPETAATLAGPAPEAVPLALDSLKIVAFMVELERRLGVVFPDELIDRSTFASVGSVEGAVRGLQA